MRVFESHYIHVAMSGERQAAQKQALMPALGERFDWWAVEISLN